MKLVLIESPDSRWDEFVSQYPHLIFHTSVWAGILKNGYQTKLLYYVLEDKGEWLLAAPGVLTGRFLRLWYSLIPYGGFIGRREYISMLLELISKDIRKYKIDRLQIVDPQVSRCDEIAGLVGEESYRFILDLENKTQEDIWRGYETNLRWSIRKASNRELSVQKIKDMKEMEIFYNLYLASMRRNKGIVRYPAELFGEMFSLVGQGKGEVLFAQHKNTVVAGVIIIYSLEMAHSLFSGSRSDYLYLRANDLLRHAAIIEAMRKGKKKFDFLSSSKNLAGLIGFKDKWGTQRRSLFSLRKDNSKVKALVHGLLMPFFRISRRP